MTVLTLITSVLNGMPYLDAMLASVPSRPQIEHLAIDAGSTDGTLERLRRRRGLELIERPGLPLYAAWNEAVRAAAGPWVAFLNADDELPEGALDAMLEAVVKPEDTEIYCGEAQACSESQPGTVKRWCYSSDLLACLDFPVLMFGTPLINAKLFRRDLILQADGFDESFAFAADREFLLRLTLRPPRPKLKRVPSPFYRYRIHAGSKTLQQTTARRLEIAREHRRIAHRFAALPDLDPTARRLLRAWLAHENAVMVVHGFGAGRRCEVRLAFSALRRLVLSGPRVGLDLARAAAARRRYRDALQTASGPTTPADPGDGR